MTAGHWRGRCRGGRGVGAGSCKAPKWEGTKLLDAGSDLCHGQRELQHADGGRLGAGVVIRRGGD